MIDDDNYWIYFGDIFYAHVPFLILLNVGNWMLFTFCMPSTPINASCHTKVDSIHQILC
jgi:hypothetical protein